MPEKNLLILGDSIAQGAYDYKEGGWVSRLQKYFYNNQHSIEINNLALDLGTTTDLLNNFENLAKKIKPNIIIFAIGINDSGYLEKNNPFTNPKIFEQNIQTLIDKSKKYTNKIIFIGLTNVDEEKTKPIPWNQIFYENKKIQEYNQIIKSLCNKNSITFINMFQLLSNEDLEDGIHPNSKGHKKIFDKIIYPLNVNKII